MKTIKLKAKGGVKEFTLPHAQAILKLQLKMKSLDRWEIVDTDKYEFNGGELNAIKRSKKTTGDETKPVGGTTGKSSAK